MEIRKIVWMMSDLDVELASLAVRGQLLEHGAEAILIGTLHIFERYQRIERQPKSDEYHRACNNFFLELQTN
jgi:hypothetical protein